MRRDLLAASQSDPGILTRLDEMLAELRQIRKFYLASVGGDADDVWVANSHSNGNRGLKQTAAMLAPSVVIK